MKFCFAKQITKKYKYDRLWVKYELTSQIKFFNYIVGLYYNFQDFCNAKTDILEGCVRPTPSSFSEAKNGHLNV